jgi:hypothetical protein
MGCSFNDRTACHSRWLSGISSLAHESMGAVRQPGQVPEHAALVIHDLDLRGAVIDSVERTDKGAVVGGGGWSATI